jgi:DNA-binding NarL/FixJ family response regulator
MTVDMTADTPLESQVLAIPPQQRRQAGGRETRVLIVDDDARFRGLARTVLTTHGYAIAAEAADGAQALAAAHRAHPDAALVDIGLPDIDGLTLARELTGIDPRMRILLTSTDATVVTRAALASSTALAFIPKDELAITDLKPWLGG